MFFFDGHCDTITTAMKKNEKLFRNSCHIDIERLCKFENPVQVFSIWLEKEKLSKPFFYTNEAIDFFEKEAEENSDFFGIAKNYCDIAENMQNNKVSGILGIEGCEAFEGKEENIYNFFERGVRVFTITWNYENELGFGAATKSRECLKPFGKRAVQIINELNGIVDVSHLNEAGFWDICEISDRAFIASHSNSKKVCGHFRNLSDEQIVEISKRKGIIGINLYPFFLQESGTADIYSIIKHIEHILEVGGEEVLGIGCDFDGIDCSPRGIENVLDIEKLYLKILEHFGENVTKRIVGDNFLNFFRKFTE